MEELVTRYSQVQLATLVDAPPEGDQWLHEIKYDGYRLLAFLEQDDVKLYTRNGNDWTHRFPAVRASSRAGEGIVGRAGHGSRRYRAFRPH